MKVISVQEVLTYDKGDPIPCLTGKVTKVGDYKDGLGKDKDGSLQTITLSDIANPKKMVAVKLWDKDEIDPQDLKGERVWIYSEGKGKGVSVDEYKDEKQVKVNKSATLSIEDPADEGTRAAEAEEPEEEPKEKPRKGKPQSREEEEEPAGDVHGDINEIKAELLRNANCLVLSANAALYTVQTFVEQHGVEFSGDTKQHTVEAIADNMTKTTFTTLYLSIKDRGYVRKMPAAPLASLLKK